MSKEPKYVPPPQSWHLKAFIEAPVKEIKSKIVSCGTCPVSLACLSGPKNEAPGGTGYACKICGATAVYIDEPQHGKHVEDIIVLDCGINNFAVDKKNGLNSRCALCSGGVMELYVRGDGAVNHYIATEHARVDVAERQKVLREAYKHWAKVISDEEKAEKKRLKEEEAEKKKCANG